ncbi:helix-turn-helix transcriptional regulator [Stackebrandtia albiflava]
MGPTLRARWLGSKMKELRKARKLKLAQVGDLLKRHQGTVSRFESGEYPIPSNELLQMLDLYGVSDIGQRSDLLQLSEDVAQRGWWDGYRPFINNNFADFVWLENNAHAVSFLGLTSISGLLQTTDYATALISNGPQRHDEFEMKRLLEARLVRKQLLERPESPSFRFLLHEALLHQQVGSPEVTAGQLRNLLSLSAYPRVELKVLPLTAWRHTAAGMATEYTVFELREPFPTVVGVDTSAGAIYKEAPDIHSFTNTFNSLWQDDALSESNSMTCIETLIREISP